ncbi:MAG: tetratricopeptide repeat protein [Rhodanobacter sp.]
MPQTKWIVIVLLLLLQACAQYRPEALVAAPDFGDASRLGERPDIPAPDDLHRLSPAQQAAFLAYFNHPSRAEVGAHQRLYQYLENLVGTFQYQAVTRSAGDALASNSGNCLSLAILTTALAQLAGVEIAYQLMDDQPVFEYQGTVVRKGVHISSLVYNPNWDEVAGTPAALTTSPGIRIDYFPSLRGRFLANLDRSEYLALYYSNIASDAILQRDYNTANWYLREALQHAPTHSASLNMLAIVNRRTGDAETAENIYRYGIAYADDKLSLLKNYHTLLSADGRTAEAEAVQRQLDTMNDPSPLHWLQLARTSRDSGDWDATIGYYQRVLQLAPYMHEVQLELAQSYYATGRVRRAETALSEAVTLANKVSTRNLYKAKLLALRKEL